MISNGDTRMTLAFRSRWPLLAAVLFVAIPPLLFHLYPSSLWANTDYEAHGLCDALNMAYRLADLRLYRTVGLEDHPGVPFYFMSWLALALTGYPVASSGPGFFSAVTAHIEHYHGVGVWLAAGFGALGVGLLAATAQRLMASGAIAVGLLAWLGSTPATLLMFTTPSIDSFALLINALFFRVLVRMAHDREMSARVTALAAAVSAFAYLNKLSYIGVSLALAAAGILNLMLRRAGAGFAMRRCLLFTLVSLAIIVAVGCLMNGWDGFTSLLRFHRRIVFSSGLYGNGDQFVLNPNELGDAVAAMTRDRCFAMPIALAVGLVLVAAGLISVRRNPQDIPTAVIATGAGLASALSAAFVFKHYDLHYTAGVAATLPAAAAAGHLLLGRFGYRPAAIAGGVAAALAASTALVTAPVLTSTLAARSRTTELAAADLAEIRAYQAADSRAVAFFYKVPLAQYGEGFSISCAGVPRLADDYRGSRRELFSVSAPGFVERRAAGEVGAFVIDRNYFPTADRVRASSNLTLLETSPVTFEPGDRLVELRTMFLMIRKQAPR